MLAAMLAGFGFAGNVFAECQGDPGELVVHVNGDNCPLTSAHNTPLFTVSNIAPGDSATGTLRVKNAGAASQTLIIEAVNFADPLPDDNLARALNITISLQNGSGYIYNDTLANFFKEREYKLAKNFAGGTDYTYKVVVYFPADKGNDWQEKSTSFDLMVGFQGSDSKGVTLTTISSGGGRGGDRAVAPLKYFDYKVKSYCLNNGTVMAMFTWKTDAPATGRALHASANSAKFDAALPDFGYQATKWETKAGTDHMAFAFGLFPVQTYDWRLDMATADSRRVTTQSLGTFTAPACVLGASDEKDIIEDVMGVSTGVLGEMTDEEIAQFMADLRAENQNSGNDQSGNKIAVATFAPAALAASNAPASASSQNSATANYGVIAAFAFLVMALVGRFLAKHLTR